MIVLGIDTATSSTVVGLRMPDGATIERRDDPSPGAHPGHATRLLAMADEMLEEQELGWSQIARIAVGVGPGTFTGLRVGIATARGLSQSLDVPLAPVSSLGALVHAAVAGVVSESDADGGMSAGGGEDAVGASTGPEEVAVGSVSSRPEDALLAVIDARRGEVFVLACDPSGRALGPVRAVRPEGLAELLRESGGAEDWLAFGDGALRYREQLESIGVRVPPEDSGLHLVSAAAICELGARDGAGQAFLEVVPDYVRRPDAELTLEAASAARGSRSS